MNDQAHTYSSGNTIIAASLFLVTFFLFVQTLCPEVYWWDTGEFLSALSCLGLAHSPSFPSFIMLSKWLTYLPVANIAMRGNLSSAFFGALLAVVIFRLFRVLFPEYRPFALLMASIISLAAVLNPLTWFQCLKAEVYTLNSVILFLIITECVKIFQKPDANHFKTWALITILLSIGLANHLLLTAHIFPALLYTALVFRKKFFNRSLLTLLIFAILGGSIYIYLPIRSHQNPALDLGNPEKLTLFINSVTRRGSFDRFFGNDQFQVFKNIFHYFTLFHTHISPVIWLFIIPGAVFLFRTRKKIFFFIFILILSNIGITLMNKNFDANPDTGPAYLMTSTLLWFVVGGMAIIPLTSYRKSRQKYVTFAIVFAGLCILTAIGLWTRKAVEEINMSDDFSAGQIGRALLENQAPEAALFTGFYTNLRYVFSYLQIGESFRRDITIIDRAEITYWPGGLYKLWNHYSEFIQSEIPEAVTPGLKYLIPRGVRHSEKIPQIEAKRIILRFLATFAIALANRQPVYWFPSEDDVLLGRAVIPEGLLLRIKPELLKKTSYYQVDDTWERYYQRIPLFRNPKPRLHGFDTLIGCIINLGNSLDALGFTPLAMKCYSMALQLDPNNATAIQNRNIVLKRMHGNTYR